ncbi:MAG: class I SAM-dependent rRNA methyltransferase [Acidobacteriota bacterium]
MGDVRRFPRIRLKPREERRLRQGHLWVFANEVVEIPRELAPGALVEVVDSRGKSWGLAAFHPHSLITARLLGRDVSDLDAAAFRRRFEVALALRHRLFGSSDTYRLCFGESDGLPGLIVDRYASVLVVQILCAAMEVRRQTIADVLADLFALQAIVERNDVELRQLEGLEKRTGLWSGKIPEALEVELEGVRYEVDPLGGQKTGLFLDQRWNRPAVARYCCGARVLDCFTHAGGFALHAARAGAREVVAVDSSEACLRAVERNAARNGVRIQTEQADVFPWLEAATSRGERFDVVIVDPPSFAPRRKDAAAARKAYRRLNELAIRVVAPGGFLATATCSQHLREDVFFAEVRHAAAAARRTLQWLERRYQSPDHPVLPAMPETLYLKMGIFRVL